MTKLCLLLAGLCALALAVLAARPALDVDVARVFYVGHRHFVGDTPAGIVVRYAAWTLPFVVYFAWLGAWVFSEGRRRARTWRTIAFLTLTFAIGPGLIVHATLKEISHRPRPIAIEAFGGPDRFRPFTRFDGACRHNCAFPSGEASAATWMLAPASLLPAPWRTAALAAAVIFAVGTGALRMAFGGHFLSDVAGAMLITILVILAARALLGIARSDGPTR